MSNPYELDEAYNTLRALLKKAQRSAPTTGQPSGPFYALATQAITDATEKIRLELGQPQSGRDRSHDPPPNAP